VKHIYANMANPNDKGLCTNYAQLCCRGTPGMSNVCVRRSVLSCEFFCEWFMNIASLGSL
jgi:hypothetical protein